MKIIYVKISTTRTKSKMVVRTFFVRIIEVENILHCTSMFQEFDRMIITWTYNKPIRKVTG